MRLWDITKYPIPNTYVLLKYQFLEYIIENSLKNQTTGEKNSYSHLH